MKPADFRKHALALPDVVEGAHHDHPDFRANGRVMASLHPDGQRGMVKVAPAQQRALVAAHPGVFTPANGAWGKAGCTMVQLAAVDATTLRAALTDAWQLAMALPKAKVKRVAKATSATKAKRARPGR